MFNENVEVDCFQIEELFKDIFNRESGKNYFINKFHRDK